MFKYFLRASIIGCLWFLSTTSAVGLDYFPWQALSGQFFNESTRIRLAGQTSPLPRVSMLLGQSEPVSFVLQNLESDNLSVNGISIIKSSLPRGLSYDFRIVKSWYMGSRTSYTVAKGELNNPVLTPELLVKDDDLLKVDESAKVNYLRVFESDHKYYQNISSPFNLMPNSAVVKDAKQLQPFIITGVSGKQVWLSLNTSKSVKSGLYHLKILVSYSQRARMYVLEIPLEVEILPFGLHSSTLNHSVYYVGQLRKSQALLSTPKSIQQYTSELKDLKSHGVLYPTQYIGGDSESTIAFYIKTKAALGFPCDKYYFINGLADASVMPLRKLESNVLDLIQLVKQNTQCNSPKIYFYGVDEALGQKLVAESQAWETIHSLGGLVFAASYAGDITSNNMAANLDSLVFGATLFNPKSPDVATMRKLHKEVLLYNYPQSGIPSPFIYRKNYGFYLIKHNFSGAMPFAYQFGFPEQRRRHTENDLSGGLCFSSKTSYCSVWNNFDDGKFYDHMFTYPTTDGVIDTVQWEGYAAAITDTRYYYTLLDLMQKQCKTNDNRCKFDPMSLIDVDDPSATRLKIIDKIKVLLNLKPDLSYE